MALSDLEAELAHHDKNKSQNAKRRKMQEFKSLSHNSNKTIFPDIK